MTKEVIKAVSWGVVVTVLTIILIIIGSRKLSHFDAALIGYTFSTLFAIFGVTYRYVMWLQRPPTALYWKRSMQLLMCPKQLIHNLKLMTINAIREMVLIRFVFNRSRSRWGAHMLLMWGCLIAIAITFPLVFGWIHFETQANTITRYIIYIFGFPTISFDVHSVVGFIIFHGLVWSSILVIAGVMLAMRRRMVESGAAVIQEFANDFLPLILLFAVSITGLMLTVSYTWIQGYAYDFLAGLHAITVIFTLLWLPFGKFFHIFQRPAQLGVRLYQDIGAVSEQAVCRRCDEPFASKMQIEDLIEVQRQLGFSYTIQNKVEHYQWICPKCRRALPSTII